MDELEKQVGTEQQQGAQAEATQGREAPGQITLAEDGTLNIPEGFWDEVDRLKQEPKDDSEGDAQAAKNEGTEAKPSISPSAPEAKEAEPGLERYTPEELAEAFVNGEVDPRRLTGELVEAYNAIDAAVRRRAEAQRIEAEMRPQQQPPAQQQSATWAQLAEAAKVLAAQHYLGIRPEEFDEFNPQHVAARYTAMQDIRDRANAMAVQQQRAVQVQSQVAALWAEYRQKVPDIDEIGEKFFPVWRQKLTVLEDQRVNEILASGDMGKLRGLIDRVVADYRGKTAPKPAQTQKAPPPVMETAGGSPDGDRGIVDASSLGDMTIEEQAKWLVENKFAV